MSQHLKNLSKDLDALQARLATYEDALLKGGLQKEDIAFYKEQVAHYRSETSRVRTAVLELSKAVANEIEGK